jgi:predicted Zn-ribbon and HTH transcriptional regulator
MAEAEEKLKPIRAILEAIREKADYALKQLQEAQEERSMRWQCKNCRWIKHFTRPASLEAAGKCPRCKSISFEAVF